MPVHERQVLPAKPYRESQLNKEFSQSKNSMYQVIQIFSSDWMKGQSLSDFAELYRELGRFEEAQDALKKCPADDIGVPEKLMQQLIN